MDNVGLVFWVSRLPLVVVGGVLFAQERRCWPFGAFTGTPLVLLVLCVTIGLWESGWKSGIEYAIEKLANYPQLPFSTLIKHYWNATFCCGLHMHTDWIDHQHLPPDGSEETKARPDDPLVGCDND